MQRGRCVDRFQEARRGPGRAVVLLSVALLILACGPKGSGAAKREAPRPVEVYQLGEVDPSRPMQITGSVSSWKEQDIGFEVGGVVNFVQERGSALEGRWEDSGEVRVDGQILAQLDDRSFRIAVSTAEAAVEVARQQIGVVDATLTKVLPANLQAALAEEKQAEAEYERYKQAGESNAVSVLDVLRAKTGWDVGIAKVAQVRAAFAGKEAEKRALQASLEQAKEELENARWQLGRCQLYAPFTGEVSEVLVEAGGYVQPGQAVAHLVMMDPIQVELAVSAETVRSLRRYEHVRLSVPGIKEPLTATIYELATVADPRTRTFTVSLIIRNRRRSGSPESAEQERGLPTARHVLRPHRVDPTDPKGRFYVESRRSLHKDDQGWFVWVSATTVHPGAAGGPQPVVPVKKVRVKPGERFVNYQGIYVLQELIDPGELTEESILPLDLPADFPDGGKVVLGDAGWSLHPGQIVSVLLAEDAAKPGIFVPMTAVLPDGDGTGRVFLVEDGKARPVRIRLGDRTGPLVRLSAVDPKDASRIGSGAQVIRQAHFLQVDEAVRVVRTYEVRP